MKTLLRPVAAWAYSLAPEASGTRDLRIDLLRGFCVFVMTVDHVGGESSWLYALTGGNSFFVSAAEGFVLLSGITMGMVYASVLRREGSRAMLTRIFGRARFLYTLTVGLTIAFAGASSALGTPWTAAATPATDVADFVVGVATLHRSYSLADVLVLYTLLVAVAAPALWLIGRGRTLIVLGASLAMWLAAQVSLESVPRAWQIVDGGFPFSAWQLLFAAGLAIGFHRRRIALWLAPGRLVLLAAGAIIALALIGASGLIPHEALFDKNGVRIGRVLALLAAASIGYAAVTLAWRPVHRLTGGLLLTLGQRSLFAYGVQLFVVAFFASELVAPVRLDRENALFQAAAVAIVWFACRVEPLLKGWLADVRASLAAVARSRPISRGALALPVVVLSMACGLGASPQGAPVAVAAVAVAWQPPATAVGRPVRPAGRAERIDFYSASLGRTMQLIAYLPPGYDASTERYPTLYMLHGGGGTNEEWIEYGLLDAAEVAMRDGSIEPFVIVLPQGDQEYWVDHVLDPATGANGERWGSYVGRDVVAAVDKRYRTIADPSERAIGGLSMGGHGAMQLALTFPGVWSVVGAHSPSLRVEGDDAPTYLGTGAAFAARAPASLIAALPDLAREYSWWIDAGDADPWGPGAEQLSEELAALGARTVWHAYEGDHSMSYWSAHTADYLAFYGSALASPRAAGRPAPE